MKRATLQQHAGDGVGGFTLLEMMIVIVILTLSAAAVMPGLSSSNKAQLDLATEKVAAALRFTRSEAIRTGNAHGIILDHDDSDATGKDIVVYQLDTSGSPFTIDHVVTHPVSRKPYDIYLVDKPEKASISIQNSTPVFMFDNTGNSQHLHFAADGRPVYYLDGEKQRLLSAGIRIGEGAIDRTIVLSTISGQVSVQ